MKDSSPTVSSIGDENERNLWFWFAGITDGEGCFFIELQKPDKHHSYVKYRGNYLLRLRADDAGVLNHIKSELGFGKIYPYVPKHDNPCFYYKVSTVKDCCKLVELFDEFQLRSKKLKDYLIWREFILYKRDNFRNKKKLKNYLETLETFYHKLKNVRRFTEERED